MALLFDNSVIVRPLIQPFRNSQSVLNLVYTFRREDDIDCNCRLIRSHFHLGLQCRECELIGVEECAVCRQLDSFMGMIHLHTIVHWYVVHNY